MATTIHNNSNWNQLKSYLEDINLKLKPKYDTDGSIDMYRIEPLKDWKEMDIVMNRMVKIMTGYELTMVVCIPGRSITIF